MFSVIGCSNIEPPENAYVEWDGDRAAIGCLSSTKKVISAL